MESSNKDILENGGSSDSSASEVGFNPRDTNNTLSEEMKEFIKELFKAMPRPTCSDTPEKRSRPISIPIFHPGKNTADPKSWLSMAEHCISKNPCDSDELIVVLSNALKGPAASWFSRESTGIHTWENFKIVFTEEYIVSETSASTFADIMKKHPSDNGDYVSLAVEMLGTLKACFKESPKDEIYVSFVLAYLGKYNPRIQHLVYAKDIKSKDELVRELRSISAAKRRSLQEDTSLQPEHKKKKFSSPFCKKCKSNGHYTNECRKAESKPTSKNPSRSDKQTTQQFTGRCYKCEQPGHTAAKCFKIKKEPSDKFVGMCAVNPQGQLDHNERE